MTTSTVRKIAAACTVLGLATVAVAAAPKPANAWWYPYGYGYGGYASAGRRGAAPGLLRAACLLRAARLDPGSLAVRLLGPRPLVVIL